MALIKGYTYTYGEMLQVISTLNKHHKLPVKGGLTKFSEESFTKIGEDEYFIGYDKEWTGILGTPKDLELNNDTK